LAPGLFAGIFAVNSPAGFLGALFGGLVAGWLVRFLNDKIKLSGNLQSVKGLLILPLSSCLGIFIIMNYILVPLCTWIMNVSISILTSAKDISPFLFGGILSGITAIGMGSIPGRVCFAVAMMIVDQTGSYMPFTAMTCGGSCVCLGIAIAMLVAKNKFTVQERAGIVGLIVGWLCIITEMCIPYALKDPKRVFPAMFLGGFIGGGLVYVLNVEVPVMHGGMFVAPLANNFGLWAVCILATAIVTAAALIILKPNLPLEETTVDNNLNN
jgi:PTS system fructose-specific IIC component